jgi:4-hydroxy-tetrahydrodipicolinate synthase
MKMQGVYTALVTPFFKDEVDYQGLRKNIKLQLKEGVDGILPLGTTGEAPTLSRDEQDNIIRLAVDEAKGKALIMVGTGSNCTRHTVENTRRAKELGADAALIVTPYYNKPTQAGILRHFEEITREVELPLVVYNIQGRTGINIETATMKRLSRLPHVVGVKEASGNINQIGDVIEQIQNENPNFSVLSGDDALTLPLMALGGRGVVSVVSNLVPAAVAALVRAALAGDFEQARRHHFELMPLFKGAFIESNPIPIKAAMELCGMPAGKCRLPLCEMQPENRERLAEILKGMNLLR